MSDYRDPKVTNATDNKSSMGKWVGIAIAAILILLLLAWLLGMFNDTEVGTTDDPAVTTEETVPPVTPAPAN